MAARDLTAERLRELLHYDPDTGVFTWKISKKGFGGIGCIAGGMNKRGYWRIGIEGCRWMANVLAWLYMTGSLPVGDVDHKDGIRSNNRWTNLRDVGRGINNQNQRRAHKNNKSGLLGVSPNRNKWAASIVVDGKKSHLGSYDTPELAHEAYVLAKREMHTGNML